MAKKGYILSYADLFRGIVIGIIIGAAVVFFLMNGQLPFLPGKK